MIRHVYSVKLKRERGYFGVEWFIVAASMQGAIRVATELASDHSDPKAEKEYGKWVPETVYKLMEIAAVCHE